jgi:hypothetical protein
MFLSIGRLGNLRGSCNTVSSNTYPKSTTDKWTPIPTETDSPNYDATCKCFKPGYKPKQLILYGLQGRTPNSTENFYWEPNPWLVCVPPPSPPAPPAQPCPTTTCPVCKSCPTCPTCPKCPVCSAAPPCPPQSPCPQCEKCAETLAPMEKTGGEYGPVLGLLLAVIILGGGGYYAYRKLGKKKK